MRALRRSARAWRSYASTFLATGVHRSTARTSCCACSASPAPSTGFPQPPCVLTPSRTQTRWPSTSGVPSLSTRVFSRRMATGQGTMGAQCSYCLGCLSLATPLAFWIASFRLHTSKKPSGTLETTRMRMADTGCTLRAPPPCLELHSSGYAASTRANTGTQHVCLVQGPATDRNPGVRYRMPCAWDWQSAVLQRRRSACSPPLRSSAHACQSRPARFVRMPRALCQPTTGRLLQLGPHWCLLMPSYHPAPRCTLRQPALCPAARPHTPPAQALCVC